MSAGHFVGVVKPRAETYAILGEGDTAKLYAKRPKLVTSHDLAYGGGVSIWADEVYIDQTLYREIMEGRVQIRGMTAKQIIGRIFDHEHAEKSVVDGDNPCDHYLAAHGFATCKENEGADDILGAGKSDRYEDGLTPALKRCIKRFIRLDRKANPPKQLWCGPHLDNPDDDDRKILAILRAKGCVDAFKRSKVDVHYGIGTHQCKACEYFECPGKVLSTCGKVDGLVRDTRGCDLWEQR